MNPTRPRLRFRRSARGLALLLVLAIVSVTSVGWAWGVATRADSSPFPHQAHARLFPVCETCHEAIASPDSSRHFPSAVSCAECHDGTRLKRVPWNGRRAHPSNLAFAHGSHQQREWKETPAPTCRTCHAVGDTATFMAVDRATPASCQQCHAHRAPDHLARENTCSQCHVPLTRATGLSDSTVAALPVPAWHDTPGFLSEHSPRAAGDKLQCATCHARESCARCHPNATEVSRTAAVASDARVARALRGVAPEYFTPPSHGRSDWASSHGDSAKGRLATCASCHAQPSCATCHIGRGAARQIARLSRPDPDGARGVRLRITPVDVVARGAVLAFPHATASPTSRHTRDVALATPAPHASDTLPTLVRIHPADFGDRHGASASSGQLNCLGCHEERTCSSCHNGGSRRQFHAVNFMSRHGASAAGREQECASCHTTETFCRECHRGQALASTGARNVVYHDRQPNWLQQHGQSARLEMQSCVSCHQQRDCTRCHSDLGLRVNPHGPGFDAARMSKRNPQLCLTCHLTDPLRSRR